MSEISLSNLPRDITKEILKEEFEKFGKINEIKIYHSKTTIFNTANIKFDDPEAADKAVLENNYLQFGEYEILVIKKMENFQEMVQENKGNIYIRNLDTNIKSSDLHESFSNYGEIISVRRGYSNCGEKLPYCYVQFKNSEDAEKAISELDGANIEGKEIKVQHFTHNQENVNTNIFVRNLPPYYNKEKLDSLFSSYGTIISSIIHKNPSIKTQSASISFSTEEEAKTAIDSLNASLIDNQYRLTVNLHRNGGSHQVKSGSGPNNHQGKTLFVKNLPDTDEESLKNYFGHSGIITYFSLNHNAKTLRVGYSNIIDANKAIKRSLKRNYHKKVIHISKSLPKVELEKSYLNEDMISIQNSFEDNLKEHFPDRRSIKTIKSSISIDQMEYLVTNPDLFLNWINNFRN